VASGEYVLLTVSDTGLGMEEAVQEHIFEPFFTTKEQGKGTGLGLATVYGIVRQSGGHIWLYSEVGRGTTFKIYLPQVQGPGEVSYKREESGLRPKGTETILLVEDEPALRSLADIVLKKQGYNVLVAADGAQALAAAEEYPETIDLLVTDVIMPQMGGKELAAQLQARIPALKILYNSGYTDDAIVHHGVLEEGVFFLQKPFTPTSLARKVREVLDAEM
jgi:two-component system cell cycle sensor histidine kinase/response regulator CckA